LFGKDEVIAASLERILAAANDSVGQIEVDDYKEPFRTLYQELTRDFGDLVRDVGCGTQLFRPRTMPGHFVRQDYMLRPGVVEDLLSLHARLTRIAAAETPSRVETAIVASQESPPPRFDMLVMQGEAAAEYLTINPIEYGPSGNDHAAFICDLKSGASPGEVFVDGWSPPEERFIWTDGKRARLKLPRGAPCGTYRIRLVLRPFVAPPQLAAQSVTLSINGQVAGRDNISQFAVIEIDLPWAFVEGAPDVMVGLDTPDAARPSDLIGQT
jgi:hypothetical protein